MAKKKRKKHFIIGGIIVVIVAVIAFSSFKSSNGDSTSVQADLAYVDDISEVVTASGRIQPQTKVDITSEVSAQIMELYVSEGEYVEKGGSLILLDTIQLQSDASQARFNLDEISARAEAARTQFEKDKIDYDQQKRLRERELISETECTNAKLSLENSKANYDAVLAQVKTVQARLEKAEDNLSKTRIRAPMSGIVTYLQAEAGEIAQAQTAYTQGKVLMTIADLSVFEVEVNVDETEIAKVKLGQETKIRVDALRDTSFAGSVVEIGNSARIEGQGSENYTTNFSVKIRFDETVASIRPGMSATVDITTATETDVLLIPYAAVTLREFDADSLNAAVIPQPSSGKNDGTAMAAEPPDTDTAPATADDYKRKKKVKVSGVFVIENGLAKFVEVATGIADDHNVVALSGITPGDTVISGTFKTIRDLSIGDAVEVDEYSLKKMKEDEG